MPRWVKVLLVAALVVAAVLIVVMALAGGEHGPGLHAGTGGTSGVVAPLVGGSAERGALWR
jgi:hypothetical protein